MSGKIVSRIVVLVEVVGVMMLFGWDVCNGGGVVVGDFVDTSD